MDSYTHPRNHSGTPHRPAPPMNEYPDPDIFARPIPIHGPPSHHPPPVTPHLPSQTHLFHSTPYHPPLHSHTRYPHCTAHPPHTAFPPLNAEVLSDPYLHQSHVHRLNRHAQPIQTPTPQYPMHTPMHFSIPMSQNTDAESEFRWRYPDFGNVFDVERDIESEGSAVSPLGDLGEYSGDEEEDGLLGLGYKSEQKEGLSRAEIDGYRPGYAETIGEADDEEEEEGDGKGDDWEEDRSRKRSDSGDRHSVNEPKYEQEDTQNLDMEAFLPRSQSHLHDPPSSPPHKPLTNQDLQDWEYQLHHLAATLSQKATQLSARERRLRKQEHSLAVARQDLMYQIQEINAQGPCGHAKRNWGRDRRTNAWMKGDSYGGELSSGADVDVTRDGGKFSGYVDLWGEEGDNNPGFDMEKEYHGPPFSLEDLKYQILHP